MDRFKALRPTPALIVAMIALVAALSGAAAALPGKGTVGTNDIKKGAVKGKTIAKQAVKGKNIARAAIGSQQLKGKSIRGNRLKDGAVKSKQIADGAISGAKLADGAISGAKLADGTVTARQIAAGTVTGAQIADGTITSQQVAARGLSTRNLSDVTLLGSGGSNLVRVTATDGADADSSLAAAPKIEVYSEGQLTVYAKCAHALDTDVVDAGIYVETTANGAIFDGPEGSLTGGDAASDFLNPDTPEDLRSPVGVVIIGNQAEINNGVFDLVGADGTHLGGELMAAAKGGDLAGGNGVYGAGDVCLFGGTVTG